MREVFQALDDLCGRALETKQDQIFLVLMAPEVVAAFHVVSHKGRVEAEPSPPKSYMTLRKKSFQVLSILAVSLSWLQFSHL